MGKLFDFPIASEYIDIYMTQRAEGSQQPNNLQDIFNTRLSRRALIRAGLAGGAVLVLGGVYELGRQALTKALWKMLTLLI